MKARNTAATTPGQKLWVIVNYLPPTDITTNFYDDELKAPGDWSLYYRMLNLRSKINEK